jgi:hypothetical protein
MRSVVRVARVAVRVGGVLVGLDGVLLGGVVVAGLVMARRVVVVLGSLGVVLRRVQVVLGGRVLVSHEDVSLPHTMRKVSLLSPPV